MMELTLAARTLACIRMSFVEQTTHWRQPHFVVSAANVNMIDPDATLKNFG